MFDFFRVSAKNLVRREEGSLGAKFSLSGIHGQFEWPTAGTPVAQSSQKT